MTFLRKAWWRWRDVTRFQWDNCEKSVMSWLMEMCPVHCIAKVMLKKLRWTFRWSLRLQCASKEQNTVAICGLKLCFRGCRGIPDIKWQKDVNRTPLFVYFAESSPEAKDAFVAPLTSRPLWPWPPSHLLFESMRLFWPGFKLQLAQAFFGWTTRQWCWGLKSDRYWQIWLKLMFQVWPSELRLAVKERAALELVEGSLVISLGSQWHTARYGHWKISFAPQWMFHDVSIGCPKSRWGYGPQEVRPASLVLVASLRVSTSWCRKEELSILKLQATAWNQMVKKRFDVGFLWILY